MDNKISNINNRAESNKDESKNNNRSDIMNDPNN